MWKANVCIVFCIWSNFCICITGWFNLKTSSNGIQINYVNIIKRTSPTFVFNFLKLICVRFSSYYCKYFVFDNSFFCYVIISFLYQILNQVECAHFKRLYAYPTTLRACHRFASQRWSLLPVAFVTSMRLCVWSALIHYPRYLPWHTFGEFRCSSYFGQ